MFTTQELLNRVAYPSVGQNLRRKSGKLHDQIKVATGKTTYNPFTSTGTIFTNNQVFPLSGNQIFAITKLSLYLQTKISSGALYASLLELLQQSYLEINVDNRQMIKIPLIECLSYYYIDQIGTDPQQQNLRPVYLKRVKNLIIPIVLNSQSNVQVNVVLTTTAAADFNNGLIDIMFDGIAFDKLDTLFLNFVQGKQFSELASTLWETQAVSTTGQNTFNFFVTPTTLNNRFSGTLPLSTSERFEIQAIEIFIGGNVGTTDVLNLVRNNRINNQLVINVENVKYFESNISDMLSIAAAQSVVFNDNAATPVSTSLISIEIEHQNKILEIPLIIPAVGNVQVQLTQPAASLNSAQFITLMLKGKKTRQVI